MQAPEAIEVSPGRDPPEPKKVSLGIFVEPSPQGLVVTGLRREGWCTAVGMEPGDVIQQINQYPATSSEELRIALQDQIGASRIHLSVVSADGSPSNFLIPLPLAEIEPHILGFFLEMDSALGVHIVSGIVTGGLADVNGIKRGSCLRHIDGVQCLGRSMQWVRKAIFGVTGGVCVLGMQRPGESFLTEVALPRELVYLQVPSADAELYCDGWSEKQFDPLAAAAKVDQWRARNPPHLAGDADGLPIVLAAAAPASAAVAVSAAATGDPPLTQPSLSATPSAAIASRAAIAARPGDVPGAAAAGHGAAGGAAGELGAAARGAEPAAAGNCAQRLDTFKPWAAAAAAAAARAVESEATSPAKGIMLTGHGAGELGRGELEDLQAELRAAAAAAGGRGAAAVEELAGRVEGVLGHALLSLRALELHRAALGARNSQLEAHVAQLDRALLLAEAR